MDGLVSRIAVRMCGKGDREGPAVWSTVQANLAFMDDPRISRSLSRSDFDFADLKTGKVSVFAVLPAPYLDTFSRWLRLLVGSALDRILIGASEKTKPDPPVLFVLDEFAHLKKLEAVETAYGLARGAGVKLWIILQNLSQLDEVYERAGRENFIANSGAVEIFNVCDNEGCRYFSEKMGTHDVEMRSISSNDGVQLRPVVQPGGAPESPSHSAGINRSLVERPWMRPHEIATLDPEKKILFRRGKRGPNGEPFSIVEKVWAYKHPELKKLAG